LDQVIARGHAGQRDEVIEQGLGVVGSHPVVDVGRLVERPPQLLTLFFRRHRASMPSMIRSGTDRHNRCGASAGRRVMPAQDHYLEPAIMTEPGTYQPLFADLPRGIAGVAEVTHGLLIHEHLTGAYGFTLTDERRTSLQAGIDEQCVGSWLTRQSTSLRSTAWP